MSNVYIEVVGYKNNYSIQTYNGHYALHLKKRDHVTLMNDTDYATAFNYANKIFFNRVSEIVSIYGYKSFSIMENEWVLPSYGNNLNVKATANDYIPYVEYIEQTKMCSMFQIIEKDYNSLTMLLKHSASYQQFENYIESYLAL